MSLKALHISKRYGLQQAVDNVSFSVRAGEVVGFLGPNGAGKSTTMKIITGGLAPSGGSVHVCGFDVLENPLAAKRIIGYLPEHNPLYLDMYVKEYLEFVGSLYELRGADRARRIATVVERCGLGREQGKKLGALSKGYRQRVGLAQALVHDPKALILDEPTSGLDPNQIVEIRKMIAEISHDKTVLFSTHIMQEAQALCKRVVIIHQGKVAADDDIDALLHSTGGGETLFVQFKEPVDGEALGKIAGVQRVLILDACRVRLASKPGVDIREQVFSYAAQQSNALVELRRETQVMEHIFRELTAPAAKEANELAG